MKILNLSHAGTVHGDKDKGFFWGEEGESNKHIKQTKVINVMGHAIINSIP